MRPQVTVITCTQKRSCMFIHKEHYTTVISIYQIIKHQKYVFCVKNTRNRGMALIGATNIVVKIGTSDFEELKQRLQQIWGMYG